MNQGIKTIIYPVKDINETKEIFSKLLGIAPYTDSQYYVGFKIGEQEIGLDPNGHSQGMTGAIGYFHVDNIKQSLELLLEKGASLHHDVIDVGNGKLIASVKDKDGNLIGLIQLQ